MRRRKTTFLLFTLFSLFVLQACGTQKIANSVAWPIESFEYTDQQGDIFSSDHLQGKVWIANFIFTNCETICPPMTFNLAKLQQMLADEDLKNVEFVSFSVDPKIDQPEVLTEFAARFTANTENWHFLTGYVQEHIEQFARDNFKAFVDKPAGEDQVIHGTDFYLVDQSGNVVKYYSGLDVPYSEVLNDVKILLKNGNN